MFLKLTLWGYGLQSPLKTFHGKLYSMLSKVLIVCCRAFIRLYSPMSDITLPWQSGECRLIALEHTVFSYLLETSATVHCMGNGPIISTDVNRIFIHLSKLGQQLVWKFVANSNETTGGKNHSKYFCRSLSTNSSWILMLKQQHDSQAVSRLGQQLIWNFSANSDEKTGEKNYIKFFSRSLSTNSS